MGGERFGLGDRVKWIMKKRQKVGGGGVEQIDSVIVPWVACLGLGRL